MVAISKEMKELIGEHEAIKAYMHSLTKSAEDLTAPSAPAKERLWNYRCRLHDFKDAIWYHLEVDEKVFKSLLGEAYGEDCGAEHEEIQKLVNDLVALADDTSIDKLDKEQVNGYCSRLGTAFDRICKLIELHIAKENAILDRVQKAPNHN
jgi:hemerythrin-like domain-containing protein